MSLSLSISCGDDKKISTQGRGLKQAERLIALAKFSSSFDIHQNNRRSTILFHGEKHLSSAFCSVIFLSQSRKYQLNSGVKQPRALIFSTLCPRKFSVEGSIAVLSSGLKILRLIWGLKGN